MKRLNLELRKITLAGDRIERKPGLMLETWLENVIIPCFTVYMFVHICALFIIMVFFFLKLRCILQSMLCHNLIGNIFLS